MNERNTKLSQNISLSFFQQPPSTNSTCSHIQPEHSLHVRFNKTVFDPAPDPWFLGYDYQSEFEILLGFLAYQLINTAVKFNGRHFKTLLWCPFQYYSYHNFNQRITTGKSRPSCLHHAVRSSAKLIKLHISRKFVTDVV